MVLTTTPHMNCDTVFDTFPWPQFEESREENEGSEGKKKTLPTSRPSRDTVSKIDAVAAAAREVRRVRAEMLRNLKGGLRALYRTLELPGANPLKDAHAALDTAVLAAYGFSAKKDMLAQLLALNLAVAAKIEKGEAVTPPGVPKNYPDVKKLVTADSIQPTASRDSAYAVSPSAPTHPDLTPEQAYADSAHHYSVKEEGPPYRTKKL